MKMKDLKRSDFNFWTNIKTRWRDMDSLGHLNHTAYLSYLESARVDLYIDLGYSGIRKEMDESTILASMDVHYFLQASHPASLELGQRISRIGTKSFDILSGIFRKDILICSAIFKMVSYDYKLCKTIPVPELIRNRCQPLE